MQHQVYGRQFCRQAVRLRGRRHTARQPQLRPQGHAEACGRRRPQRSQARTCHRDAPGPPGGVKRGQRRGPEQAGGVEQHQRDRIGGSKDLAASVPRAYPPHRQAGDGLGPATITVLTPGKGDVETAGRYLAEQVGDEAYLDVTAPLLDLGSATAIAAAIRTAIREETELTASAGVSYNKFLAKLASDHRKPDGLFVITPRMGPGFVEDLPIGKFHGVGPGHSLANEHARNLHRSRSTAVVTRRLGGSLRQECRLPVRDRARDRPPPGRGGPPPQIGWRREHVRTGPAQMGRGESCSGANSGEGLGCLRARRARWPHCDGQGQIQ